MDTNSVTGSAAESSPIRQSCDRCHKQKLRCTRESSTNSGACDKCIRKRAQCIYSFALPKGRPSRYRTSPAEPARPIPAVSSSPALGQVTPTSLNLSPSPITSPKPVNNSVNNSRDTPPCIDNGGGGGGGTIIEDPEAGAPTTNASALADPVDSTLIGRDQYTSDWDWNGADDWHRHAQSAAAACNDASTHGIAAFAALLNQPMTGDRAVDGMQEAAADPSSSGPPSWNNTTLAMDHHHGAHVEATITGVGYTWAEFDPDLAIAELSTLSARLSTLRRSCYNVVAALKGPTSACPGLPQPLLQQVSFKAACDWLAYGPGNAVVSPSPTPQSLGGVSPSMGGGESKQVGHLLHQVYTASYLLLEIVRSLQINLPFLSPVDSESELTETSSESSNFHLDASHVFPSLSVSPTLSTAPQPSLATPALTSPSEGSGVIYYLVMACHTMLLNVFIAVFLILERETEYSVQSPTPVLSDIRLVFVVQTCSYLIKRLRQSLESYLPLQLTSQPHPGASAREEIKDLQGQINNLLERIEGRLRL
ncbi:hypothetical protein F4678DRAFT_434316 [Xylaria arbuscula]|nr:hypothetical protein F4678DRAFT_434316 [Xylaria arbuscula]